MAYDHEWYVGEVQAVEDEMVEIKKKFLGAGKQNYNWTDRCEVTSIGFCPAHYTPSQPS